MVISAGAELLMGVGSGVFGEGSADSGVRPLLCCLLVENDFDIGKSRI